MTTHFVSPIEWQNWLILMLTPGVGNETARRLLTRFGSPEKVLQESLENLRSCVHPKIAAALQASPNQQARECIARTEVWLEGDDAQLIYLGHPDYPSQLLEIPDPPLMLYVKGQIEALTRSSIAIVGSRNATHQGVEHAYSFAKELSTSGWCISSGLAAGIDAAAHHGGLEGEGGTIAVIGTGIDIVYPARHRELAHRIVQHGCIVSEYPLGTAAISSNFPRRNRIISGLSKGVLVVEAAEKSGSLITARMAAEQGRDVFAIPGSIHSPLAKGCHLLIKQGAKLVDSASDINEEYAWIRSGATSQGGPSIDPEESPLLVAIGHDPVAFEVLLTRCSLESADLSAQLFELELQGQIEMMAGGLVRRVR